MIGRSPQECRFRLSVAALIALGLGVLASAVADLRPDVLEHLTVGFWLVTVLVVVGELRPIITPGTAAPNGLPTSTAFVGAVLLHRGLALALVLQVVAIVIADVLHRRTNWRTAFAIAQRALSLGAAALVLDWFGLLATPDRPVVPTGADLPALALAAAAYFTVDDLLVCGVVRRLQGRGLRRALTEDLGYDLMTTGALLALSPLLAVVMAEAPGLLPLFVLPLAAVYSTAKVSLDRDRQAHHDPLTGLPNRSLLVRRVDDALAAARSTGGRVALIVLDLDRFKEVNDTLGHPTGDRLLQVAAARLARVLRPGDTIARLGGDEFAIVLPRVADPEAACEVGRRVRAALATPFHLDDLLLELDACVGVAVHPERGAHFGQLLQRADIAMYLAKESRTGVELYVGGEDHNSTQRLALLGELRGALERGEIELRYQPKARLTDGAVLGSRPSPRGAIRDWGCSRRPRSSRSRSSPAWFETSPGTWSTSRSRTRGSGGGPGAWCRSRSTCRLATSRTGTSSTSSPNAWPTTGCRRPPCSSRSPRERCGPARPAPSCRCTSSAGWGWDWSSTSSAPGRSRWSS